MKAYEVSEQGDEYPTNNTKYWVSKEKAEADFNKRVEVIQGILNKGNGQGFHFEKPHSVIFKNWGDDNYKEHRVYSISFIQQLKFLVMAREIEIV